MNELDNQRFHVAPANLHGNRRLRNVLFVWSGLAEVGGVQLFLLQALRHLPDLGFQPYVLDIGCATGPLDEQYAPFASFILRAPELSRLGKTLWSTGIAQQLQRLDIELVVLNEWMYSRILQDLPPELPAIAICHVDHNDKYYHVASSYADRLQSFVAVSNTIARKLCDNLPSKRHHSVHVIHYGVESYVVGNRQNIPASPLRLMYLGRLVQTQKRISDLVPFVKSLDALDVDYVLTIAGTGEAMKDLQADLSAETLSGCVKFLGPLPHGQAMNELSQQHVYLLFSEYEGLPISLLEALICGVVPVVTDIRSGVSEILTDYHDARLFPVGQPEVAATIIAELARDPASLNELSTNAADLGAQFRSEETFRRFAQLFAEATAEVDDAQSWWADVRFQRRQRMLALVHRLMSPFAVRIHSGLTKLAHYRAPSAL